MLFNQHAVQVLRRFTGLIAWLQATNFGINTDSGTWAAAAFQYAAGTVKVRMSRFHAFMQGKLQMLVFEKDMSVHEYCALKKLSVQHVC